MVEVGAGVEADSHGGELIVVLAYALPSFGARPLSASPHLLKLCTRPSMARCHALPLLPPSNGGKTIRNPISITFHCHYMCLDR